MTDINSILARLVPKYGLDTQIPFMCGGCNYTDTREMPFDNDFFTET